MNHEEDVLKDGIYEKVISTHLAEKLLEALKNDEIWVAREDVDPQEASSYLSRYLARLIKLCLCDIADKNETTVEELLSNEVGLVNEIVALLRHRLPYMGDGQEVVTDKFLLRSVQHKINSIKPTLYVAPETSLTKSFLFTGGMHDISLVSELIREIKSADRIDLLVSFIKRSGLLSILPYLREFTNKGGKLRVLTTTYMGATDPVAVTTLAELPHTEVRISYQVKSTRLHAKSYIFHRDTGYSTAYIGSSNLSHAAITDGLEWNMKMTESDTPSVMEKVKATFETYWHSEEFQPFTMEDEEKLKQAIHYEKYGKNDSTASSVYTFAVKPYYYQEAILDHLEVERKGNNRWKNLIVAATGTGKTAISAFDYARFAKSRLPEPTRLLFVAHRKEILEQSRSCFRQVLQEPNFGELCVGEYKPSSIEHLFMSIQSFHSQAYWKNMDPSFYDMIIVDEFHHAAAHSYQKLLTYFRPKILLGLTATPERMDNQSILTYFDGYMSAEIRLSDAIEKRLLCPFHYFGVTDAVDLSQVHWRGGDYVTADLEKLYVFSDTAKQRARQVIDALQHYGLDFQEIKALGFCVSQKHAAYMAEYMNSQGISSVAIDAHSTPDERRKAKQNLETGKVKIIFAVDIFNEGVDIPAVNTVLFLRPTNSITVFIQQLGRGLRLAEGKDFLTVLDFVAQSNKKYNFSDRYRALTGKPDISVKNEIENYFPHAPKGCFIQLEKMAASYILENIRKQVGKYKYYVERLYELYETMGKVVPTAEEFFQATGIDPLEFYNGKRTYTRLCIDAKIVDQPLSDESEKLMQKLAYRLFYIDSISWLNYIIKLWENPKFLDKEGTIEEIKYQDMWKWTLHDKNEETGEMHSFRESIQHLQDVKGEICSLLYYQMNHLDLQTKKIELPYSSVMEVYGRYTRDQIFSALGFSKPESIKEGVKYLHTKNSDIVTKDTDVFLVTLNKSEKEFSNTTLYQDYSINKYLFHWQSQRLTSDTSPTGMRYREQNKKGNIVLLFVRQSKKDNYGHSLPYMFLGPVHFVKYEGSQPMTIIYRLENPIPAKYISMTDTAGMI